MRSVLTGTARLSLLNLFHYKCFEHVAFLDIVKLIKSDTAFVTLGNLANVILEALER